MTVRIGINPLTWSNDDLPSLGAENSLETCLTEARAAGYAGVELGNKFPRDAAKLRPILQAHRLALVSGGTADGCSSAMSTRNGARCVRISNCCTPWTAR